jgi:hypothetical protein
MYTILFIDEHYDSINWNSIDDSCIVYTKCFDKEFIDTLYIRGILTIYVLKTYEELVASFDLLFDFIVNNNDNDKEIVKPLQETLSYISAKNDLMSFNTETEIELTIETPDKFQKTMHKEAKKVIYAENREKYKQKMRQTSLSNRKSIEKLDSNKDTKKEKETKEKETKEKETKKTKH